MDKIEKIRQESEELYVRIDECIDTLIKARLNKDTNGEGKSLFQMEGLMVGTQQFLCWISDTLSEELVALNKADKIKQILRLSVEYYKQEVFGKFDTEDMTEEREDHRAKWILERLPNEPDSEDLEEEVKNYFQGYWPGTETAEQCNTDLHFTPLAIMRLARHFAEWGAEQLKK